MKKYTLVLRGDEVSKQISQQIKAGLKDYLIEDQDHPDLVISIGGDGTILESVHQYLNHDCCFVGVHTGTLGFFTDYQKDEVKDLIEDIKNNQYQYLPRHLLEVKVKGKENHTFYALNEMRLDHGYRTQVISVYINNHLLEVFRGNGLCVSTPSGSTGYNKSLGGSIIYPGHPLMQLSEVAGIHHNAYRSLGSSLILDDRQVIKLIGEHFDDIYLGIDHLAYEVKDVDSIEIRISDKAVNFVEYKEMSFITRVRRAFISE